MASSPRFLITLCEKTESLHFQEKKCIVSEVEDVISRARERRLTSRSGKKKRKTIVAFSLTFHLDELRIDRKQKTSTVFSSPPSLFHPPPLPPDTQVSLFCAQHEAGTRKEPKHAFS